MHLPAIGCQKVPLLGLSLAVQCTLVSTMIIHQTFRYIGIVGGQGCADNIFTIKPKCIQKRIIRPVPKMIPRVRPAAFQKSNAAEAWIAAPGHAVLRPGTQRPPRAGVTTPVFELSECFDVKHPYYLSRFFQPLLKQAPTSFLEIFFRFM